MFDIVSICLGRNDKHKPVTFEALVVKSINSICMAGASGFAKKLERKGFCLADDRLVRTKSDCVQVDLLIGADNYISFVSPFIPKTQAYGMWVDKTYYDEILLNGKIPGSTSSPTSGINMACIYNISAVESTIPQE